MSGGECVCGRGQVIGTCTWTSGRVLFRAFHDGPAGWHDEQAADQVCVDCVADIVAAVASGEVLTAMRKLATKHRRPV